MASCRLYSLKFFKAAEIQCPRHVTSGYFVLVLLEVLNHLRNLPSARRQQCERQFARGDWNGEAIVPRRVATLEVKREDLFVKFKSHSGHGTLALSFERSEGSATGGPGRILGSRCLERAKSLAWTTVWPCKRQTCFSKSSICNRRLQ